MPEWNDVFAGSPAAPRPASNGVGVAGFVCGLISLVAAIIPLVFFFVSVPTGVAGVILSVMGRWRADEGAPSGDLARTGLVLSIVSLAWTVIWFVAVF